LHGLRTGDTPAAPEIKGDEPEKNEFFKGHYVSLCSGEHFSRHFPRHLRGKKFTNRRNFTTEERAGHHRLLFPEGKYGMIFLKNDSSSLCMINVSRSGNLGRHEKNIPFFVSELGISVSAGLFAVFILL
jgi:hypothetical protein